MVKKTTESSFVTQRLDAFIADEMDKPFRVGETDCVGMADRWVRLVVGYSPLSAFGRMIRNDADAKEWIAEPGGLVVGVNRVMRHCGFKRTATPQAGDIGLVIHDSIVSVAVRADKNWFSRDAGGFLAMPLIAHWKAWDVMSWA